MAITFPVITGCWYRDDNESQHNIHWTPSLFYQPPALTCREVLGEGKNCMEQVHPGWSPGSHFGMKAAESLFSVEFIKLKLPYTYQQESILTVTRRKRCKKYPRAIREQQSPDVRETGRLVFQAQDKISEQKKVRRLPHKWHCIPGLTFNVHAI